MCILLYNLFPVFSIFPQNWSEHLLLPVLQSVVHLIDYQWQWSIGSISMASYSAVNVMPWLVIILLKVYIYVCIWITWFVYHIRSYYLFYLSWPIFFFNVPSLYLIKYIYIFHFVWFCIQWSAQTTVMQMNGILSYVVKVMKMFCLECPIERMVLVVPSSSS